MEVQIDEDVLKRLQMQQAENISGQQITISLKQIYSEIDKLEKTKIEITEIQEFILKILSFGFSCINPAGT